MDAQTIVTIVIAACTALVLLYVVHRGRGLRVRRGSDGVSLEVDKSDAAPASDVSVGRNLEAGSLQARDITGVAGAKDGQALPSGSIDVLSGAKIGGEANIRDLTGIDYAPREKRD